MKRHPLATVAIFFVGLFIHPSFWANEHQRTLRICTPRGHTLNGLGGLVGLAAFVSVPVALALSNPTSLREVGETVIVPLTLVAIGQVLHWAGWVLAKRKGFHYDDVARQATWLEDGVLRTMTDEEATKQIEDEIRRHSD